MPTPLDLLRLSEDLRQKKEELFNGQMSKEQLKDRVVMQARKKMNLLASAHAFGQSHDLMSEISSQLRPRIFCSKMFRAAERYQEKYLTNPSCHPLLQSCLNQSS